MSKHRLSPALQPHPKRQHTILPLTRGTQLTFDNAFYDELILFIFAHLSWVDLCAIQSTNRNWSRLASDNELWKDLYLSEYGRRRLRGARGFIGRNDGREVRPLPGRARVDGAGIDSVKDWKWMFRISSNWRTGRCAIEQLSESIERPLISHSDESDSTRGYFPEQTHIILAGSLTITASSLPSQQPRIYLRALTGDPHPLLSGSSSYPRAPIQITALALDQSPPGSSSQLSLASFLSTGEFTIFSINHATPSSSTTQLTYVPLTRNTRNSPIIQAVYSHPILITLSQAFNLSIYDLSARDTVVHSQTLSSFTSHPPSSLVLSTPSPTTYKLVLAYAIPVYPAHWSVGATELIISGFSSAAPASSELSRPFGSIQSAYEPAMTVLATRTARAFDVPQGWIDDRKMKIMREQWGRKVENVSDTQTDGKWVIIAPGRKREGELSRRGASPTPSSNSSSSEMTSPNHYSSQSSLSSLHSPTHLQLYRLHLPSTASSLSTQPKLTFVRNLHGQTGSVSALSLADGRCVSLSTNGSIWVWDLEGGTGAEVAPLSFGYDEDEISDEDGNWQGKGTIVFDERRIISAGRRGVQVRRFDV